MPLRVSRDPRRHCDACGQLADCFYMSLGDKSNAKKFRICRGCIHQLNVAYVELENDPQADAIERYT